MPGIVRKGDVNTAGGAALGGELSFIVDGRPVVTVGTLVSPHAPCGPRRRSHCRATTRVGDRNLTINQKPVNVIGNPDSCGHLRATGSRNFIVG